MGFYIHLVPRLIFACFIGWKSIADGEMIEDPGIDSLSERLNCNYNKKQPIHSQEIWSFLRNTYQDAVTTERSSIAPLSEEDGFKVPFEVLQSPGKGRGVYATAAVQKGDVVWTDRQVARFTEGSDYRSFLASIPVDLACDILQWAYVKEWDSGFEASVDLDEGSFMNNGDYVSENVGCPVDEWKDCFDKFVALRDIEAGEEFLTAYSSFDSRGVLDWYDDVSNIANVYRHRWSDYDYKEDEQLGDYDYKEVEERDDFDDIEDEEHDDFDDIEDEELEDSDDSEDEELEAFDNTEDSDNVKDEL